jgi:hypothetical protein
MRKNRCYSADRKSIFTKSLIKFREIRDLLRPKANKFIQLVSS